MDRRYPVGGDQRPQTLTELSEHDRVSPASMSQTVNRLTSAGYAVRTRDPSDGRKVLFSATAEGDELAGAARAQRARGPERPLRPFLKCKETPLLAFSGYSAPGGLRQAPGGAS
jgi:DNA-binding MarR family transcriptional regulator